MPPSRSMVLRRILLRIFDHDVAAYTIFIDMLVRNTCHIFSFHHPSCIVLTAVGLERILHAPVCHCMGSWERLTAHCLSMTMLGFGCRACHHGLEGIQSISSSVWLLAEQHIIALSTTTHSSWTCVPPLCSSALDDVGHLTCFGHCLYATFLCLLLYISLFAAFLFMAGTVRGKVSLPFVHYRISAIHRQLPLWHVFMRLPRCTTGEPLSQRSICYAVSTADSLWLSPPWDCVSAVW